jgi:hypothetical protein
MITDGAAGLPVDGEVRAAADAVAADCTALGHEVEPLSMPFGDPSARDFLRCWWMLAFLLTRLGRQAFGAQSAPTFASRPASTSVDASRARLCGCPLRCSGCDGSRPSTSKWSSVSTS